MHKDSTYRGHETWFNAFRMGYKMFVSIFRYCFFVHLAIFAAVYYWLMPDGSTAILNNLFWKHFGMMLSRPFSHVDPKMYLDKTTATILNRMLAILIFTSIPSYLAGYPLFWNYFRSRAKDQVSEEYVRGSMIVSPKELMRMMKRDKGGLDLPIGQVKLPISAEVKHLVFIGSPGTGKTNQTSQMIERLKIRREKMVIYDFKGDYLSKFYDPATDIIFNPLDQRCLGWTLFNELTRYVDVDAVAHSLIPQAGTETFWNDAARDVFSGLLHYLYQNNAKTNADIWAAVTAPIADISKWCKDTKGGERGYVYIQDASSKQAMSIVAVMMQYTKSFEYMSKADGDFSIMDWLNNDSKGAIFITNYADVKDTLRPILSLFIDLLGRKLLSMKDDYQRRVFFILDEFGTLQRLSTIKDLLTLSRSKGGAVCIGIQDKGQIDKIYSHEYSQSILNACSNSITFRVSDPITAKYLSDRIGKTEVLAVDQGLSMGVADNRDGVSLMQRSKEKDLVMPSEIQNLRDMEAYLKIANYPVSKINFAYKKLLDCHEPFMIREDLLLDNILKEQQEILTKAQTASKDCG